MAVTRYIVEDNGALAWSTVAPAAGDLLVVCFARDGSGEVAALSGFTRFDPGNVGSTIEAGAYYRICTGSETGNVFTNETDFGVTADQYGVHAFKVPAAEWNGTTPPEMNRTRATSGTPDPPSLSPSWGSAATLWIVWIARDLHDGITSITADYTANFAWSQSSTSGPEMASSWRINEAASEDVGAIGIDGDGNEEHIVYVIAVRPGVSQLAVPDNFTVDAVPGEPAFTADWDAVAGAVDYALEAEIWDGDSWEPFYSDAAVAAPPVTLDDTDGVAHSTLYRVRARAQD